jgi:hypothetical protein
MVFCSLEITAATLSTFQECEMENHVDDRRVFQSELPEGLVRRHDTTTLVQAALVMQREAGTEKASTFLQAAGVGDEVVTRVLHHGLVRAQDLLQAGA